MAGTIRFFNEQITFRLKDKRAVSAWIKFSIVKAGLEAGQINFIFCSDPFLLKINRKYLDHDYFTDIITFPNNSEDRTSGDIYISIDRVRENAVAFRSEFINELHRVMIHGILHLLGYNDKHKADQRRMRSMENKILSLRTF